METYDAIYRRRSIRRYKDLDIEDSILEKILSAGLQAPSSKNKQPWKFIITKGKNKQNALRAMKDGIEKAKLGMSLLPNRQHLIPAVEHTLSIMQQAPVVIWVFNTEQYYLFEMADTEKKFVEISNILSIGAAIENMLIMAADLGIGSLWVCDTVFAYKEICTYFNEGNQLVSAITLGYTDEETGIIGKKDFNDVVKWL